MGTVPGKGKASRPAAILRKPAARAYSEPRLFNNDLFAGATLHRTMIRWAFLQLFTGGQSYIDLVNRS